MASFEGARDPDGAIENATQKSKAEEIARSASGVKKVNNLLELKKH